MINQVARTIVLFDGFGTLFADSGRDIDTYIRICSQFFYISHTRLTAYLPTNKYGHYLMYISIHFTVSACSGYY